MSPEKRPDESPTNHHIILAFTVIQLISAGGLTLVLLTALINKHVKRHSTWYSFTVSWIFSSICYTLLCFAGQQIGDAPNHILCTIQTALIYAAPVLTSCTILALIIHMFLSFRILLHISTVETGPVTELILLSVPYLVWAVIVIGITAFSAQHPDTVQRSSTGTYCVSNISSLPRMVFLIVIMATVVVILLLSVLAYRIIRNRRFLRSTMGTPFCMLHRVFAFSIIGIVTLLLAVTFVLTNEPGGAFDILLACIPLLALLIFGSQRDLVRVWLCRRNEYIHTPTKDPDDSGLLVPRLGLATRDIGSLD